MVDWTNKSQRARFAASVAAVQAGDNSAAEELIAAMKPAILQCAKYYGDPRTAMFDELVQAGRVAVWEAAKSYDSSRGASVASHCCNRIRWRIQGEFHKYSRDRVLDNANSLTRIVAKGVPDRRSVSPEEAVVLTERLKAAMRQLDRICNKKTRYVTLRRLRGDKYIDIARDLGVSKAAVHARGQAGLKLLACEPMGATA